MTTADKVRQALQPWHRNSVSSIMLVDAKTCQAVFIEPKSGPALEMKAPSILQSITEAGLKVESCLENQTTLVIWW